MLATLGVPFTIQTSDIEERGDLHAVPEHIVAAVPTCSLALHDHPTIRAWRKVADVRQQRPEQPEVILGADTVVVLDGAVLNKPADAAHARSMLEQLSGRTHMVYTGLCVCTTLPEHHLHTAAYAVDTYIFDLVASTVTIDTLTSADITTYVATGEPLDKAGSYGIQGLGGRLVRNVVGSYTAVVGLPLPATTHLLATAGMTGLHDPVQAFQGWLRAHRKETVLWPSTLP
ncbi:MAG: Maf-like protein [Blastochloris sp.]|nr:Maf-like protein [Blastochloris sp.]